jgi:hypothetical protein
MQQHLNRSPLEQVMVTNTLFPRPIMLLCIRLLLARSFSSTIVAKSKSPDCSWPLS